MSFMWIKVSQKLTLLSRKKAVKYGLPFMVMVVGGSFGLKEFAQLRYTFSKQQKLSRKDMEQLGLDLKKKEEVTLETAYDEVSKINLDNWHNIRGPRPWEEPDPELVAMKSKSKTKKPYDDRLTHT